MIVLDVETTGTEASKHSLLSIGAVDLLKPERQFYGECRAWDGSHVMDEALEINGFTRENINDPNKKTEGELVQEFLNWAEASEVHTIAGQNPSLDHDFVKWGAIRNHLDFRLPKRMIDLHTVCYTHMVGRGLTPPLEKKRSNINSEFIAGYVGIPAEIRPHIALNGAKWEAEALSRLLYNKHLLDEYKNFPIPWIQ